MRNRKIIVPAIAALAVLGLSAAPAIQAFAATDASSSSAVIVTPITLLNTAALDFGIVAPGTAISVIRMSTAGARTVPVGDAVLVGGGTPAASSFDVTGTAAATYAITLPGAAITLTSGADTMTVDTFTDSVAGAGTLSGAGTQTFTVGGDLNVAIAQPVGTYSGTFNVTVNYN